MEDRAVQPTIVASLTATVPIPIGALSIAAAPPEAITTRNAEAVLGLSAHEFKRLLLLYPGRVVTLGRLRLVKRTDFCEWIFSYKAATAKAPDSDPDMATVATKAGLVVDRAPASHARRTRGA